MNLRNLLLACFSLLICISANSQTTVSVTVNSANISTTCTDIFSSPDPTFQVNINGEGYVTYPSAGNCYTDFPNEQFSNVYNCGQDIPLVLNVCFKVFENDNLFGCGVVEACSEEICQDFALPQTGNGNFTLSIPNGGDSAGTLDFTVNVSGLPLNTPNDEMCNAENLGVLSDGIVLGDAAAGSFDNLCATFFNELDICDFTGGGNCNVNGVWFTFTTGAAGATTAQINALSDPQNTGNDFPMQMTIYEAIDGTCNGNFDVVVNLTEYADYDASYTMNCLPPNTTYYIAIDGNQTPNTPNAGVFGIEVVGAPYPAAPDALCDALDLGTVPTNGTIGTPGGFGNICATSAGNPPLAGFGSQNSVFFSFVPPPTGHVLIEGTSLAEDPIGIQIALYNSSSNDCSGTFTELQSSWDSSDFDETLEASCLDPNRTYWILIDGEFIFDGGFFEIDISDAGDDTPVTNNAPTLCAGGSVVVGTNTYDVSGFYSDTLPIGGGCFEVINTDLTILDELIADVEVLQNSTGENEADGAVNIVASGGDGNYTYAWSNGLDIPNPTNLLGGSPYCVTVTDANACEDIVCFEMPFIDFIFPTVTDGQLLCNGDNNGIVSFFVQNGLPPYTYNWDGGNGLTGGGVIAGEGEDVELDDLTAGTYSITVSDSETDTVFTAIVSEPDELLLNINQTSNVSCFGTCDGALTLNINGGTQPYSIQWQTGETTENVMNLCAGTYQVVVTDANQCQTVAEFEISEPAEFIATASVTQAISCFEESDGMISVSTNGNASTYSWDTPDADVSASVDNLPTGTYSVTVTNEDGCQDIATIFLEQPDMPLLVSIELTDPVSCGGESDGALMATTNDVGTNFTYLWSTGQTGASLENIPAGIYSVTAENENGCTATTSFTLDEPEPITAEFSVKDLNCPEGDFSGALYIESVMGGEAPYTYSTDGQFFTTTDTLLGLSAGDYVFYVEDALGCQRTYDFTVLSPPELSADLGDRINIFLGESVELNPNVSNEDVLYVWQSSETIPADCITENCASIEVTPTTNAVYSLNITDTVTMCTAFAEVDVFVNKERFVFIPDAFSPNDDGINDEFYPRAPRGVEQIVNFQVFDRYGSLMFSNQNFMPDDPSAGWNGFIMKDRSDTGIRANTGVYVYQAEILFIDGETEVFGGDITLLR